jgi:hypothetical protein
MSSHGSQKDTLRHEVDVTEVIIDLKPGRARMWDSFGEMEVDMTTAMIDRE